MGRGKGNPAIPKNPGERWRTWPLVLRRGLRLHQHFGPFSNFSADNVGRPWGSLGEPGFKGPGKPTAHLWLRSAAAPRNGRRQRRQERSGASIRGATIVFCGAGPAQKKNLQRSKVVCKGRPKPLFGARRLKPVWARQ